MGRMYTLDNKLLCGSPEIRIGDKLIPVDDRHKTVRKALKIFENTKANSEADSDNFENLDELFKIALGENYKEVENLSFAAYKELAEIVIAAMTGEEPEDFEKKKEQSFREEPDGNI